MSAYDVIVIGLGGMGSATAYQLAARGLKVLGLEQYDLAHDQGSSHGESRMLRQAYFEGDIFVPLLLRAYDLWAQTQRDADRELMLQTGGLYVGPEASHVVSGSLRAAQVFDLPHDVLTAAEIARRFPMMRPDPHYIGVYEERGGVVFPERSVEAFCTLAARHGAELHFGERVLEWEADSGGDGVMVDTAQDTYEAGRLVITAGPWANKVMAATHLPIQAERVVMHWFEPQVSVDHFAPGRFPVHVWQLEDGLDFYGFPALAGSKGGVKIALHNDVRDACDPDTVNRVVYASEIEAMRRHVRRFFPDMDGRHLTAKTCMYTSSPDDLFIIDRHPDYGQVIYATGFSGHGFKFAPVIGEILGDLAAEGTSRHDVRAFGMGRFG